MINLILFGPPGSGKGTQAVRLIEKYQLVHISTGDLFRYEIGNNTPLGKKAKAYMDRGELVPDEVTVGMLRNKVDAHPDAKGFIFDGFPRNINQSQALDAALAEKGMSVSALLALQVDDDEIVRRILKRGETSGRSDDNDEGIIRRRINVFKTETAAVFDYYATSHKSHSINGIGDIEYIFGALCSIIDSVTPQTV